MPSPQLPPDDLGLRWRAITLDDIDLWHALEGELETHDDLTERYDRDDLVEELTGGSHKDPARDSLIGVDSGGVARAFGQIEALPGTSLRRVYLWGGVHPEWRTRGVGRALLAWQLARANEVLGEQRGPGGESVSDVPWRIVVNHREPLADRNALCEAAGLVAIRWFHDMLRPLGDEAEPVPAVTAENGFQVVPWTEDLDDAARLAHNESFAGHWGSQPRDEEMWRLRTTGHRSFRRDWSRVVLDRVARGGGGRPEIAGYVACHAYPQDWAGQGYTQGWIDLLGVRPAWRGRGLAPALLASAMNAFAESDMQTAGLDVDTGNASGALDLYSRMGFHVEETSVAWALQSPDADGL